MQFLVSVCWIVCGLTFLGLARSYRRTGALAVAVVVGAIGLVVLVAGFVFHGTSEGGAFRERGGAIAVTECPLSTLFGHSRAFL